ncbi:LAME_0A00342g1_1 [Lachancea meyersii CBS 8951]|uniref:3-hydroxyisobutyrate dehydrogenase n=1 Tax=Lachancea meyersii CBS 8951 TaxID=1266667 RepID=A0A1G4ILJ0_9SACH|nr:LAME_0A00342g1_1 [Lachancea meyersii CBS 8951]
MIVAFVGLGNMGGNMAANLVTAGYHVVGFDPAPAAVSMARSSGVELASSGPACVREANVIFTMLPSAEYVDSVWAEIIPEAQKGAIIVDCSTIDVTSSRALHKMAQSAGLESVDAPVSGGMSGARAGKLTFMVGGNEAAIEEIRPLLEAMGQKVVHCGGAGAGQAAKICNNMILGANIVAVSEAFALAEKLNLAPQSMFDVASTSTGQCWALNNYCPIPGLVPTAPSNNDYKPGAAATMLLKDLKLAQDAAADVSAKIPLASHVTQIYADFVADGHGDKDFSAIIRALR